MKNKFLLALSICFFSVGLIGCGKQEVKVPDKVSTSEESGVSVDFKTYEVSSYEINEKYDGKCIFLTSVDDYERKCPDLKYTDVELNEEFFKEHNIFIAYTVVSQGNIYFTVDSCALNTEDSSVLDVAGKVFSKGDMGTQALESRSILVVTDKNITNVNFSCN